MNNLYLRFLRRWWWLLVIAIVVALGSTAYTLGQQQKLYRAQATIQVGRTIEDKNPAQDEFAVMDRLVPAYAELAKRDPILLATADTLKLPLTPDAMRLRLLVTRVPSAPLIDIVYIDSDPQRAAMIANEIARQVVLQSPTRSQQDEAAQEFVLQQVADLQKKITEGQTDLVSLQNQIATQTSASDIEDTKRKLTALDAQIESWQASYARLVSAAEPSKTNLVSILSTAMPPTSAIPSQPTLYYALALVIGAGLAILLALGLDRLKRPGVPPFAIEPLANDVPLLSIPHYRVPREAGAMVNSTPDSPPAAAYRLLRNALSLRGIAQPGTTLAIMSSRLGEGKTTTGINLAIAMANTRRKVILVDANMHNPELDRHFNLPASPGFADLLLGESPAREVLQPTTIPNLQLITAGSLPEGYADLISTARLQDIFPELRRLADVIIFDTPAIVEEREALLIAKHVTGVVVIVEASGADGGELRDTMTALGQAGSRSLRLPSIRCANRISDRRSSPGRARRAIRRGHRNVAGCMVSRRSRQRWNSRRANAMVLGMPAACLPSRARRPERREGEHMRILALTHVVPNPPDAGPKIKTHYALRMLAREHQIELLTFARDERERAAAEALQSWCARVTIIALQRRKIREPLYLASGWLRGQPYLVARDYRLSLATAVRARLAEGGIDVVHADQLAMAQYLPLAERAGVATIFDAHNAVYDLIRDMSKRPPTPLHRPALGLEWRLLRRYEGMLSRRSARTLTVSSHDHTLLAEAAKGPVHAAIVPIGVEVEAIAPLPINRHSTRLLSIATMHYPPNAEALRWFRDTVWPIVHAVQPGIAIDVIGSHPPKDLVRWAATTAGVYVPGYVADTTVPYRNAAIFIVPLRSGSGVRVKILEAMARGIPVVSTSIGVAGLALRHNEHLLIADTPEAFATAIVQLLAAPERRMALATAARARVLEIYDWRRCCLPLLDIYRQLANERAAEADSIAKGDCVPATLQQRA